MRTARTGFSGADRPLRIVHVVDGYPPTVGGMERAVQALARAQAALGHDVRVVALAAPTLPAVSRDGRVRVLRLEGYSRILRRFSSDPEHQFHPTVRDPQLVRRLEQVLREEPADIVHAHGWIVHSAMALDRGPGTALVHTLHDYGLTCATKTMIRDQQAGAICPGPAPLRCLSCASGFYGTAKGAALTAGTLAGRRHSGILGRGERFPAVDLFLPITRAVADASLDGVDPARVRVVPSFVADDLVPPPGPRPAFLPDGDFVLFVGQLGRHKGIEVLVEAHRSMARAVPLVVIGALRPDSPELEGTAERPVHVYSRLDHETIMRCFGAAAVCAVPSQWAEPFGLVAIEAMAAGTPVVASRVGGLAEVIAERRCGLLVEPGQPAELAAALDGVLADPVMRADLVTHGRRRAADFTASSVLPTMLDAYTDALRRRARPALVPA